MIEMLSRARARHTRRSRRHQIFRQPGRILPYPLRVLAAARLDIADMSGERARERRVQPAIRILARGLDQAAQNFGDAPGLRDAAARREWRLGVKDLADRTDTALAKVPLERVEK